MDVAGTPASPAPTHDRAIPTGRNVDLSFTDGSLISYWFRARPPSVACSLAPPTSAHTSQPQELLVLQLGNRHRREPESTDRNQLSGAPTTCLMGLGRLFQLWWSTTEAPTSAGEPGRATRCELRRSLRYPLAPLTFSLAPVGGDMPRGGLVGTAARHRDDDNLAFGVLFEAARLVVPGMDDSGLLDEPPREPDLGGRCAFSRRDPGT